MPLPNAVQRVVERLHAQYQKLPLVIWHQYLLAASLAPCIACIGSGEE
jgi:hypothetical protein